MATLKRIRAESSDAAVTVPLDAVLHPQRGQIGPEQRATWCQLRAQLGAADVGTRFDPRYVLRFEGQHLREWQAERRAWAMQLFASDGRVTCRH